MLELLPAWILAVGLIPVCHLYARAFRAMDYTGRDPSGRVVLTRRERATIRDLERQFIQESEINRVVN